MLKKKTMDNRSVRHRIVLPRGERIWRMPRCWSIAVIVVVGLAGCSSREAQWSGFIPVLVVLLIVSAINTSSSKRVYPNCDCDDCRRARGIVTFGHGLMARSLGVRIIGSDAKVLEARSCGYAMRVRDFAGGDGEFTVVELEVPHEREEFPVFLMRSPGVESMESGRWIAVRFKDDERFERYYSLLLERPLEGNDPDSDGSAARLRTILPPDLRAHLKFNVGERRWIIGGRGHFLEAHLNRRWSFDEGEYRLLIAEAMCILMTMATQRSVSLELFESWRPGGHWLAGELIQGLAAGTSYRAVSLPRRAEEIAFHQRWWERGFESSVVVPDEGFAAVVGGLGWVLEVNKSEMAVTEGGVTKELVQRKVTLEGGGSVVVTVMVLHLVDDSPDLFRFRFAPRRRDQPADGEPSLFNSFVLKKLSHSSDASESEVEWQDFSADHPHFSDALWMYLASEAVSANGWFVEGFPRRLEINRGQAIDANPEDYAEFVRGASELAVAIMTDGRVTSAVGSPSSVAASGGGASVIGGEPKFSRKGLMQTVSETGVVQEGAAPVFPEGPPPRVMVDFQRFEAILTNRYPGQMELMRQVLPAAQRREQIQQLYAKYKETGVVPPL